MRLSFIFLMTVILTPAARADRFPDPAGGYQCYVRGGERPAYEMYMTDGEGTETRFILSRNADGTMGKSPVFRDFTYTFDPATGKITKIPANQLKEEPQFWSVSRTGRRLNLPLSAYCERDPRFD